MSTKTANETKVHQKQLINYVILLFDCSYKVLHSYVLYSHTIRKSKKKGKIKNRLKRHNNTKSNTK